MNSLKLFVRPVLVLQIIFHILVLHTQALAKPATSADQVFSVLRNTTYQIRIIESKSDSQTALGTGFLIAQGRIATNYHVVSNNILEPDKFRIEIEHGGRVYPLTVLTVDVVHDLAILEVTGEGLGEPYILSGEQPKNGEVLYSLGNPHNLGLTIVEGNYNGLVENKFIDRIHFSGAINSGMSGGPTVNSEFEVVGVNVATGGNQVGFLVPVDRLTLLLAHSNKLPHDYDLLVDMSRQIGESTDGMVQELLDGDWLKEKMGSAMVLGTNIDWLTCWGSSKDDKESGVLNISRGCNNGDNIYINHHFNSGYLEYEYAYFDAPAWPSAAFYRYLRTSTAGAQPGNRAKKDDVGNYACEVKVVQTSGVSTGGQETQMTRKINYCTRHYKRLVGLYDVFYMGVTQDKDRKAIMEHFTISGVTKPASLLFLERFMGVLGWE